MISISHLLFAGGVRNQSKSVWGSSFFLQGCAPRSRGLRRCRVTPVVVYHQSLVAAEIASLPLGRQWSVHASDGSFFVPNLETFPCLSLQSFYAVCRHQEPSRCSRTMLGCEGLWTFVLGLSCPAPHLIPLQCLPMALLGEVAPLLSLLTFCKCMWAVPQHPLSLGFFGGRCSAGCFPIDP